MQIHHFYVAVNMIDSLAPGTELIFDRAVGLLEQGDALVARLKDGIERLMVVKRVAGMSIEVELVSDKSTLTLNQSGATNLTVV